MINAALFWSGGKDSALCLHKILQEGNYRVCYLITTLNSEFDRISMHGIRAELLDRQQEAIGIPLKKMFVSEATNAHYEQELIHVFNGLRNENIHYIIFGDIFLEDIRSYREKLLSDHQMQGVFPLWKISSKELMNSFLLSGFKAIICCVDSSILDKTWVGKELNSKFLEELPANIDCCGENGEFHSFAFDGPIFQYPVKFNIGGKIFRPLEISQAEEHASVTKGFWFVDLIPA